MAKILATVPWDSPANRKRFYIIGLFGHTIKVLDLSTYQEHIVKTDHIEELTQMMNWSDDEWHSWLTEGARS